MYSTRIFLPLLFFTASLSTYAQSPRKVLDATADCLVKQGAVKAQFKATQFAGTTQQGVSTGTIHMNGTCFMIDTDELKAWYDGKTQWSLMNGSNEVNVSEPDEAEIASVNPAVLVNFYKRGFKCSMTKATLRGRATFVIHLWPKRKDFEYSDIYLDIDQETYHPLCIRAKHNGDWVRLSILSFQNGLKLPNSTFTFPQQDYPDAEIIDLR